MSNTQDIYPELGDEALDHGPAQEALVCSPICAITNINSISDEPLETPTQQAAVCVVTMMCGFCGVSDEALETPAPAQQALACVLQCRTQCAISDEALDAPEQHAAVCVVTVACAISDEVLDLVPAQEALGGFPCVGGCIICNISDDALAAR